MQQRLREMQEAWTVQKAKETHGYADPNGWKNFFAAIKAVYDPMAKDTAPLLSADGTILRTEKTRILHRWAEHSRGVLNRPSTTSGAVIARLTKVETNADLDHALILHEITEAMQQLSIVKALGSDAIRANIYKYDGPQLMEHLTALFQYFWCQGQPPQGFKNATIVHLLRAERLSSFDSLGALFACRITSSTRFFGG
nr:unnamed protein product [Spirometra erinaceieuropaei]